jgi:hypothetical protein
MGKISFRVSWSHACVSGPHRAGSFDYHNKEPEGRVCRIEHDNSAWFYRVEHGEVRAFKRWVRGVFPPNNGERYRVTGSFPHYSVEKA